MAKSGTGFRQSARVSGDAVSKALSGGGQKKTLWITLAVLAALALLVGGGFLISSLFSGPEPLPLVDVSGEVTYRGVPVTGPIRIVFSNLEEGIERSCELDPQGRFHVPWEDRYGLPKGSYTVWFTIPLSPDAPPVTLPAEYRDPKKSPVRADVQPGKETYDFTLPQ